jgi:anti-sigma B factor antagonist
MRMSEAATNRSLAMVVERHESLSVVRCSGRLVAGCTDAFQREIKPLIPEYKRIVIDMKDVSHVDSMGLGTLVRLYVSAKSGGCSLELANIGPSVRQLLGVTHLISVLAVIGEYNVRF